MHLVLFLTHRSHARALDRLGGVALDWELSDTKVDSAPYPTGVGCSIACILAASVGISRETGSGSKKKSTSDGGKNGKDVSVPGGWLIYVRYFATESDEIFNSRSDPLTNLTLTNPTLCFKH